MSNATQSMNPQDNSSKKYDNYGILLYIIFFGMIVLISFISIIWTRLGLSARLGWDTGNNQDHDRDDYESSDQDSITSIENGVNETTLDGFYPKFLCSEAHKAVHGDKLGMSTTSLCCSICLGEYYDNEMLRLIPCCSHLFHQMCIDPWLRMHSTCPVCRRYSVPNTHNQQPIDLHEVAPLAGGLRS